MLKKVTITDLGLQTKEGKMLMPGSTLYVKDSIPSSWKRVCKEMGEATEQSLQVASPSVESAAEYIQTPEPSEELKSLLSEQTSEYVAEQSELPPREELIADYENAFGKKPHHKKSDQTIYDELVEFSSSEA